MEYTLNSRSMSGEQRSILFTTSTLNFEKCSSFDITLGHSTCLWTTRSERFLWNG